MKKLTGLGRGLDALLGSAPAREELPGIAGVTSGERVIEINIGDIDPNRDQPRRRFDEQTLAELAQSIGSVGVIQPILVKAAGDRYQIIAGERRWRAARLAGLPSIPAIVREADTMVAMQVALIENLQRDDLNPVEQAAAIRALMDQCGFTQESVAEQLGRSRPAIANLLRLLTLPEAVLDMIRDGRLSAGHARALVTLPGSDKRKLDLARLAIQNGWSVRQMEAAAKETPKKRPDITRAVELDELENMARTSFGIKAELRGTVRRGRLVLSYYSADDLERIWEALSRLGGE